MQTKRKVKVIFSFQRTGTHYLWSRCIKNNQYQLIYDADRIPALEVLAKYYHKPLTFLTGPIINPNYNFQYNSISENKKLMTAAEHLEFLRNKYDAKTNKEAFFNCMARQSGENTPLLSVNRFVYTNWYLELMDEFVWTADHALLALKKFYSWLEESPYDIEVSLVIRPLKEWIHSQINLLSKSQAELIGKVSISCLKTAEICSENNIPIFLLKDVINAVEKGHLDFEKVAPIQDFESIREEWWSDREIWRFIKDIPYENAPRFRPRRFWEYIKERDPIKRTSLVRSIGTLPFFVGRRFPVMQRFLERDESCAALNNARLD